MFSNVTDTKLFTKISFDGYDFIQSELGRLITPTRFDDFITRYTYAKYTDIDQFIKYCCENYKKDKIMYFYQIIAYKLVMIKKYKSLRFVILKEFTQEVWYETVYIRFRYKSYSKN